MFRRWWECSGGVRGGVGPVRANLSGSRDQPERRDGPWPVLGWAMSSTFCSFLKIFFLSLSLSFFFFFFLQLTNIWLNRGR